MTDKNNRKIIDIRSLAWGAPPVPLLPRSLRSRWHEVPLPDWVRKEIGFDSRTTLAALNEDVWENMQVLGPQLRSFLTFTVKSHFLEIARIVCVDRIWPAGLKISDIGWTARTRNALARSSMLADKQALTDLTFGRLSDVRGLGATGMLDFSATLEASIDRYEGLASELLRISNFERSDSIRVALEELHGKEWADQVSDEDARFEDLLLTGKGTVRERVESLLLELDPLGSIDEGPLLLGVADEIQQRVSKIRGLPLEEALLAFLEVLLGRRNRERLDVLAERLGWKGVKPLTLKECAERLGVTRERVRQIQSKVTSRIPRHEVLMPQLDQALAMLEEHAPINFDEASSLLQNAGLTGGSFHMPTLLGLAKLLGKETGLECYAAGVKDVLVRDCDAGMVARVLKMARKLSRSSGVSSIFQVQDALAAIGYDISEDSIKRLLEEIPAVYDFLDDAWFIVKDIPIGRDRLRNTILKMLSVASPQNVISLREGVRRAFRGRSISSVGALPPVAPPARILRLYLKLSPEFVVAEDNVRPANILNYQQELGENECVMVDVLRSSPTGVLDRRSLAEACVARGMNENTFNVYTSYSSLVEHIGTDLWKLRGTEVDPAAVEAVRSASRLRTRERRLLGHEWTEEGKIRLFLRISGQAGDTAVFGCPSPIRRFLEGSDFECRVKVTNKACGKVGVDERGIIYGCKTYIQRYGLDTNDLLVAEFDIKEHIVLLSLGDEELLDYSVS